MIKGIFRTFSKGKGHFNKMKETVSSLLTEHQEFSKGISKDCQDMANIMHRMISKHDEWAKTIKNR